MGDPSELLRATAETAKQTFLYLRSLDMMTVLPVIALGLAWLASNFVPDRKPDRGEQSSRIVVTSQEELNS